MKHKRLILDMTSQIFQLTKKKVLDDVVSARAGLECDPLHSDCPKKVISRVKLFKIIINYITNNV